MKETIIHWSLFFIIILVKMGSVRIVIRQYLDWTGIQKAVAAGKLKAGKDQCFGFFMVLWLNRIRQDVKESTFSRYHFLLRTHIFPELGQIPLTELDNGILEDFVREKRTCGSRNGGGLSPKTVNCLISEILGHSDVSVTLSRYVHPSMEQKKMTIEKMFLSMEQYGPGFAGG